MLPKATPPNQFIEIEELDQANNLVATYIQSSANAGSKEKGSRIDIIIPQNTHSHARSILNAFLPAGYPNSVTSDYLEYQIYDSLQAFSSSIAGLLSSRAVLEGIGVGNASASPTSALLLSVLQDSMGRIATILFAHRLGTALEPECKMYRLLADVFNDAAMILDCLSPVFPRGVRVGVLGGSSVLRSLCGVAAGSSKASLSAHFAMEGNLGELNAKDSSQETVISLMGMLVGTVVVSYIPSTSKLTTWLALLSLLAIHLGTNYLAVRAVCMRTLNRQRANLAFERVFEDVLEQGQNKIELPTGDSNGNGGKGPWELKIGAGKQWPTPEWVRGCERVFERDGVLRLRGGQIGWCEVGVSLQAIINCLPTSPNPSHTLTSLLALFQDSRYLIAFDTRRDTYMIVLKEHADSRDVIEAWMLVFLTAMCRHHVQVGGNLVGGKGKTNGDEDVWETIGRCKAYVGSVGGRVWGNMEEAGWDLGVAALETRGGVRVRIKE